MAIKRRSYSRATICKFELNRCRRECDIYHGPGQHLTAECYEACLRVYNDCKRPMRKRKARGFDERSHYLTEC